jgi:hypothetical protein
MRTEAIADAQARAFPGTGHSVCPIGPAVPSAISLIAVPYRNAAISVSIGARTFRNFADSDT